MELDDEVCLCFHVTKRKISNYLRIERPQRAAQLSDCFGAGTGCGWCRKILQHMFQTHSTKTDSLNKEPTAEQHAQGRTKYIQQGQGSPPPRATPTD